MAVSFGKLPWQQVAFVADVFDVRADNQPFHLRHDLEQTDQETLGEILGALGQLDVNVRHLRDPAELTRIASSLENTVVFSTYGGGLSRNRLALVPAVAEALNIDFVGMDTTGQVLCHQKDIAKRLAKEAGLATPPFRILRSAADLASCANFPVPYIVKPLAQGSSIGISDSSIIWNPNDGAARAAELLQALNQPVLIEGFVGGREVSLVSIETATTPHEAFVEVYVDGAPDYFETRVFDAHEKYHRALPRTIKLIDSELPEEDHAAIRRLLNSIGDYGYIRVDGKLDQGRFVFLELTPDAWLGRLGHVAAGFIAQGWSYPQVLAAILMSAATSSLRRGSNG